MFPKEITDVLLTCTRGFNLDYNNPSGMRLTWGNQWTLNRFLNAVGCPVINIHHSFLPAFIGARPYHQAYERGVKTIGATAHYATEDLDEGPIIEQDVMRIGHRDTIEDLIRKGRDLETVVLARAVRLHVEHRVLVYGKKTVIFD